MCLASSFVLHHHRRHLIGAHNTILHQLRSGVRNTIRHQLRRVSTSTRLPERRQVRRLRDRTRPWGTAMTIKSGTLAVESLDFPRLARATVRSMLTFPFPQSIEFTLLTMIPKLIIPHFLKWNSPNSMDLTPVGGGTNVNCISRCMPFKHR